VKLIKNLITLAGVLFILAIIGTQCELKNKDQPGIIDPSNPIHLPKVNVSKR
jgi:hypothetical protein